MLRQSVALSNRALIMIGLLILVIFAFLLVSHKQPAAVVPVVPVAPIAESIARQSIESDSVVVNSQIKNGARVSSTSVEGNQSLIHQSVTSDATSMLTDDEADSTIGDESGPSGIQIAEHEVVMDMILSIMPEQQLSPSNIMVLKELSTRLDPSMLSSDVLSGLSSQQTEALRALVDLNQAEIEIYGKWMDRVHENPDAFQKEMAKLRQQALGNDLYQQLYSEDSMQISADGYSGELSAATATTTAGNGESPNESTVDALMVSAQSIETSEYERDWQLRLSQFLEEYKYVEQAGLAGEDEKQMRQELLERYFDDETRSVAEQFLFGVRSASASAKQMTDTK